MGPTFADAPGRTDRAHHRTYYRQVSSERCQRQWQDRARSAERDKGCEAPAVWSSEVSDDEIDGIVAAVSFRQFSQPRSRLALLAERSELEDQQANPDLILALPRPPRMLEQSLDPTCSEVSSIAQLQRSHVGRMVAVTEMSLTR